MTEIFNIDKALSYGLLDLKAFAAHENISSKREIETKGQEYLLKKLIDTNCKVEYDEKGKPYLLNDTRHISVSHSHDRLAIIVNANEATGIDIELIRDKVLKIKHKFLTEGELADANDNIEKLLIYWAAKETLYKIYGLKEVDFIEHLLVKPFTKHKLGSIIGAINLPTFKESFELHYQLLPDYVLVYALTKITAC